MIKRFLLLGRLTAAVVFGTVLLASCGAGQEQQQQQAAPVDVDFLAVQPADASVEKRYPGMIEGTVNVDVKVQVTGYLDKIYVKEGDYVQQGQTLFKIKDEVYAEQVENSEAMLLAAEAAAETARIEIQKLKPLVAGKVVTELQLQTAEANYAAAKAQIAQAKSALGISRINAAFTLIKAPVAGYIGRIPNRIGNLITPADATALTTLSEIKQVLVYFSLSEADYIAFLQDQKQDPAMNTVELIMANGQVYPHAGSLESASGNVDRSTGSVPLKAVFNNPDRLLRAGGSGKIVIRKNLREVLTIPMASVKDIQNKYFVFALADSNKVVMKPIEIMGQSADQYILKSGLQVGERVALNRVDVLADGMPVAPTAQGASAAKK